MNLTFLLISFGIVSLIFAPLALAAPVDLTIEDAATGTIIDASHPFSTCPLPLTPEYISVLVKNVGPVSDTYSLELTSLPTGWTGTIENEIPLAAGEERAANLFLINMPSPQSLEPGNYDVMIQASSLSSGSRRAGSLEGT